MSSTIDWSTCKEVIESEKGLEINKRIDDCMTTYMGQQSRSRYDHLGCRKRLEALMLSCHIQDSATAAVIQHHITPPNLNNNGHLLSIAR
jgi:hypothetical protein